MATILKSAVLSLRYACSSLAELAAPRPLPPRTEPLHVAFVFHVERIADASAFEPFLAFVQWLGTETQSRPLACVTTPFCPMTEAEMARLGVSEREYAARVSRLAEFADLGYHGHFYARHASPESAREHCQKLLGSAAGQPDGQSLWTNRLSPMSHDRFDKEAVAEQMDKELAWLRDRDARVAAYVAGWWVLSEDTVRLMERHGIEIDCSIRRRHSDTFGGRYLPEDALRPRGEPAILPPSRGIVEIQSAFYPVDHPRRTKELLRPTLSHKPDQPLFVALPSHEGETVAFGRALRANVRMLLKQPGCVRWTSIYEQLPIARQALAPGR